MKYKVLLLSFLGGFVVLPVFSNTESSQSKELEDPQSSSGILIEDVLNGESRNLHLTRQPAQRFQRPIVEEPSSEASEAQNPQSTSPLQRHRSCDDLFEQTLMSPQARQPQNLITRIQHQSQAFEPVPTFHLNEVNVMQEEDQEKEPFPKFVLPLTHQRRHGKPCLMTSSQQDSQRTFFNQRINNSSSTATLETFRSSQLGNSTIALFSQEFHSVSKRGTVHRRTSSVGIVTNHPLFPQSLPGQSPLVSTIQETRMETNPRSTASPFVYQFGDDVLTLPDADFVDWLFNDQLRLPRDNEFFSRERFPIATGSILVFGGNGKVSTVIRSQTSKNGTNPLGISHAGIALVLTPELARHLIELAQNHGGLHYTKGSDERRQMMLDDLARILHFCANNQKEVFCLHSTGSRGVHLAPLQLLLARYDGNVYVRLVNEPIPLRSLIPVIVRELGKTYNANLVELAGAVKRSNKKTRDRSKQFCSQLVARILQDAHLLPHDFSPNNYAPNDFCSTARVDYLASTYEKHERMLKSMVCYEGGCCIIQ